MTQYLSNFSANFTPEEALLDPVHKLRVSTPQAMIDTDFEYGLQTTKWETLELSNNIPSFYVSDSDSILSGVSSVQSTVGSNVIVVNTNAPHGLVQGSPIDVRGLAYITAEGQFLIQAVPNSTSFTYKATYNSTYTGDISTIYTSITPGQFYAGSNVPYDPSVGVTTDGNNPSTILITTPSVHGFAVNSNFYAVNTIGTKQITITSTSATAPDGNPYVDSRQTLTTTFSAVSSLFETEQVTSTYFFKFNATNVDVSGSRILWPNSNLKANDTLVYVPSSGDTQIGGLQRFQVYYVQNPTTAGFQLSSSFNGSPITFTGAGTYNYGRHKLHLCYEAYYLTKYSYSYETDFYTTAEWTGSGSGWDLKSGNGVASTSTNPNNGSSYWYGLGNQGPRYKITFSPTGYYLPSSVSYPFYSTSQNGNFTMNESNNYPTEWNFIENFDRYKNSYSTYQTYNLWSYGDGVIRSYGDNSYQDYYGYYSYYLGSGNVFVMFLTDDAEADTFYYPNHGLVQGSSVTYTLSSGSAPQIFPYIQYDPFGSYSYPNAYLTNNVSSTINVVNANRFQLLYSPSGNNYTAPYGYSSNSGAAIRFSQGAGTYSFTGTQANPTANTIYSLNHGYSGGERVYLSVSGTGAALPSVQSGSITINPSLSGGNLGTAWNIWNAALNAQLTANSSSVANITLNGQQNSAYPIYTNNPSGQGAMYQFYYQGDYMYDGQTSLGTSNYGSNWNWSAIPSDHAAGTALQGEGFSQAGTPWSSNQSVPHYSVLYTAQNSGAYNDFRLYSYVSWAYYPDYYSNYFNINVTGDWYLSYGYQIRDGISGVPGFVHVQGVFWKNSWNNQGAGGNSWYAYQDAYFGYSYPYNNSGNNYRYLKFDTVFNLQAGASFSPSTLYTFMTNAVSSFASSFSYPTLTTANPAYITLYNANRFGLQDQNKQFNYQFTSTGTPNIILKQSGLAGALDGTYSVTSTPSTNSFTLALPFQAPVDTINADATTVSNNLIKIPNGHYFSMGAKITYLNNGNANISGLTNGTTYYLYIQDDHYVGFATSYLNATSKQLISISAGTGTHLIQYNLVAGTSVAAGTVTVTAGSNLIVGDSNTLFRRYFKVGDTFIVKQNGSAGAPGTLYYYQVASITDDQNLIITGAVGFTQSGANYFFSTKFYVRPDGFAIHRPYDGGIQLTAGTAPNSQTVRQTRKYFRYQPGKGIQTSAGINFNPPVSFNTLNLSTTTTTTAVGTASASATVTLASSNTSIYPGQKVTGTGVPTGTYVQSVTSSTQIVLTNSVTLSSITLTFSGYVAIATTRYPHRLSAGNSILVSGSGDNAYNGAQSVNVIIDQYTFTFNTTSLPTSSTPSGLIEFNVQGYSGSYTRVGMYDFQNGFFLEYDGSVLWAVRRSSTQQLSGTAQVVNGSGVVNGTNSNFSGQLVIGDKVVIRGGTYRVVAVNSSSQIVVQPQYKGVSASNVIISKTIDTRVPQSQWSIDHCDGTGPTGYVLNINKMQMIYLDYSWYGAGKIRFGFKDQYGHIRYVHEFIHNNLQDIAYMRSGNLPARYEIENGPNPTYVPSLYHWGTSVIMDGNFDPDKAYLITAPSNNLTFTNGQSNTATLTASSSVTYSYNSYKRTYDWYDVLTFNAQDASKFPSGTPLYSADNQLNGAQTVAYTEYSGTSVLVYIYLQSGYYYPNSYASFNSGTVITAGATVSTINIGTALLPLISIRLAPSVDSNLTGALGAREIINRMQLHLNEAEITTTHDSTIYMILNPGLSNVGWQTVGKPSLSQYIAHNAGDTVAGGLNLYSFRASGGSVDQTTGRRLSNTNAFPLSGITDMGNSILGGDFTYPNGPDILTLAAKVIDTTGIGAAQPYGITGRMSWSESQA